MFALIDCNNFYVSCERVFNPKMRLKPIVVLSNNDGCIIARSNEVKALNVPMGAPLFQYRDILIKNDAHIFSANFALYGDMSDRVMETLRTFDFPIEVYSIDEAFLRLPHGSIDFDNLANDMVNKVQRWTGIPISVGIAPTKTLAKMANKFAKKNFAGNNFLSLENTAQCAAFLEKYPIEDVWGYGKSATHFFKKHHIYYAKDILRFDRQYVQKSLKVNGLRTFLELQGIACNPLEEHSSTRKSVLVSRSFTKAITSRWKMERILANFIARAGQKLRKAHLTCAYLSIFVETNRFQENRYKNSSHTTLPVATSYTPLLLQCMQECLSHIYREGLEYKRAGILLADLRPEDASQKDLFAKDTYNTKQKQLMKVMDTIHSHYGDQGIFFALENTDGKKMNTLHRSPHFTTDWRHLLSARIS